MLAIVACAHTGTHIWARSEPFGQRVLRYCADMLLGMDLTFEVGEREKHSVRYHFNQSSGFGSVSVDGETVKRIFQMLALSTTVHCKFSVGMEEIHHVDIQRVRKRALGGFLPQTYRVIVDGKLLVEEVGNRNS
jgi:hypothetical protein